jgi:hypothetical protein
LVCGLADSITLAGELIEAGAAGWQFGVLNDQLGKAVRDGEFETAARTDQPGAVLNQATVTVKRTAKDIQ